MIVAKKLGMTRIYADDGSVYAVTALQIHSKVVDHKTETKHGYFANVLLYGKKSHLNKPQEYLYVKFQVKGYLKEDRVASESELQEIGCDLNVSMFHIGQYVDVRGKSKGKGFEGAMKRHNFRGGKASHGASLSHRSPGSTGSCQDPGKVWKGKRMPGHLGDEYVSVKRMRIIKIDTTRNILFIHGAAPGSAKRYVEIRRSK